MASDGEISCTNDPNFAVIYSFLKVFGKLYALEVPTIAKLQEYIEDTQEVLDPLKELHLRLLRRALKSVQSNRWERCLIKFCHQQGSHQEAWEIERFSYKKASTQVKLKVLKLLLEYQFTCHPKFKSAVNAITSKDLRLDPIGRDKNGCVYWYQVDHEANLCLYKEDQDEETWQLVARTREEFVKVISQLKNGEEIGPLVLSSAQDESSIDGPQQQETQEPLQQQEDVEEPKTTKVEEENEEEFLSPESESDHEEQNDEKKETVTDKEKDESDKIKTPPPEPQEEKEPDNNEETSDESVKNPEEPVDDTQEQKAREEDEKSDSPKNKVVEEDEVSEAIEEPVMVVTGDGNGADCESSYIIGEEITEEVMFFFGEGSGYDNDTGNPEAIEQTNSAEDHTDAENGNEECLNGEHKKELTNSSSKNKLGKNVKLKSRVPTVTKRALKKQSNDTAEVLKSDPKKHCIRNLRKSDGSNSNTTENEKNSSVNDKSSTDSGSPWKNRIKKGRSKVKKKVEVARSDSTSDSKEVINAVSETDNCHDNKSSIIEKRKSSVSSVEQDDGENGDKEKEKSPDKELKAEDPLPPKKLRLESTPESDTNEAHSKEPVENINNSETKKESSDEKDNITADNDPISKRKKIKASKGKFKRKRFIKNNSDNDNSVVDKSTDRDASSIKDKKSKSLKRSLLDSTMSDKNKSESHSESEEDEPISSGKRLKFRPKKIITSSRKKVEAKLLEKHSTDESEEETLYSIAGKKSAKKLLKKKSKGKDKQKSQSKGDKSQSDSDLAPVRQSRRIAQLKIKEEADRRHLEEVTLRELKMIHKKKTSKDEEEWRASGSSSGGGARRGRSCWRAADSTDADSDSDEPLFELQHEEPDLEFNKSDHEFSPESDLESGEPVEPLKRARTLQEEKDDGFCKRCGSGEQPEWILLCDKCDAGYHASCLKPMLFLVPTGDWFCPPCNHDMLINSLESELTKYDELVTLVEAERERKKLEAPAAAPSDHDERDKDKVKDMEKEEHSESSGSSSWSSSSEEGGVYRLRARRQLPVSYRSQEYDRLISSAIKEEYVEPTTSAGNQGRGKDISTIIEAAEERQLQREREARDQGKPIEIKKLRKKTRRKPRKLNSLEVPSEDDDETDEDFKDTGMESSSEDISSSAERGSSNDSRSSDSLPIARRTGRTDKKERRKMTESSPETKKKKKGVLNDTSSESGGTKEWTNKKPKKSRPPKHRHEKHKKSRKRSGLQQYDAQGNVIRARVTYGGLSDDGENDWSPKHRTRQKKINYTEMPNTESEDEMHKSSGKHMPDSSDEFKLDDSELSSDSGAGRRAPAEPTPTPTPTPLSLADIIKKTVVVPLEKLPEDVTKAKTEELQAHLNAAAAAAQGSSRGGGVGIRGRGSRGSRGGPGRGRGVRRPNPAMPPPDPDDALAKLVGVKIKDLKADSTLRPNQIEREKKRQEREAKQAEKEARRQERLQKKEEKEKLKEQKAKEREEKKQARIALQESKRIKKEKPDYGMGGGMGFSIPIRGVPPGPPGPPGGPGMFPGGGPPLRHPSDMHEHQRFSNPPRLQVRAELRGVLTGDERRDGHQGLREGTLSVAGSPQPFKPVSEEPSIITRMPHMINQQYRGHMMYPPGNSPFGPRGPQNHPMYPLHHPGLNHPGQPPRHQYPQGYYPAIRPPPAYQPARSNVPPNSMAHAMRQHQPHQLHPSHPALRGPSPRTPPGGPPPHQMHPAMRGPSPGAHQGPPPPGAHPGGPPPGAHPGGPPPGQHPGAPPPGPHLGLPGAHPGAPGVHPGAPGVHPGIPPPGAHSGAPPRTPPAGPAPAQTVEPPIKIKAEVKTEPEYRSPAASPSPRPASPRDEAPRNHPQIKHTDSKERRPRYPLGPYAPPYAAYPPYAPPYPPAAPPYLPPHLRPPPPGHGPPQTMPRPGSARASPPFPHSPYAEPQGSSLPGHMPVSSHPGHLTMSAHLPMGHLQRPSQSPGPGQSPGPSHHPVPGQPHGQAHPGMNHPLGPGQPPGPGQPLGLTNQQGPSHMLGPGHPPGHHSNPGPRQSPGAGHPLGLGQHPNAGPRQSPGPGHSLGLGQRQSPGPGQLGSTQHPNPGLSHPLGPGHHPNPGPRQSPGPGNLLGLGPHPNPGPMQSPGPGQQHPNLRPGHPLGLGPHSNQRRSPGPVHPLGPGQHPNLGPGHPLGLNPHPHSTPRRSPGPNLPIGLGPNSNSAPMQSPRPGHPLGSAQQQDLKPIQSPEPGHHPGPLPGPRNLSAGLPPPAPGHISGPGLPPGPGHSLGPGAPAPGRPGPPHPQGVAQDHDSASEENSPPPEQRVSPQPLEVRPAASQAVPFVASASPAASPVRVKLEPGAEPEPRAPREEGSVFGGLVSYFSSQQEDDDLDA